MLIFDEVMTSRHGSGGLQKLMDVTPDMTTLGKYMAGGMSFGAFGGRADIMAVFDGHKPGTLPHAGTFNNNVWSMAAGCVAMGEIFDAATAEALYARGEALRDALNAVCTAAGVAMQFTGLGSMLTVHFRPGPITAPYAATPAENTLRELFFFDLLAQRHLPRPPRHGRPQPAGGGCRLRPLRRRGRGVRRRPQAAAGGRPRAGLACPRDPETMNTMPMPPAVVRRAPAQGRRVLLLTGASRGIGHATVKVFSAAGWRVITVSRQPFPEECPWEMGPEDHIQADLSDAADTAAGHRGDPRAADPRRWPARCAGEQCRDLPQGPRRRPAEHHGAPRSTTGNGSSR